MSLAPVAGELFIELPDLGLVLANLGRIHFILQLKVLHLIGHLGYISLQEGQVLKHPILQELA